MDTPIQPALQVAHLTANELVCLANAAVDIARGLGEQITLLVSLWVAW
ncbi:MAG: hypothetical protein HC802_17700 [Caldilineaceae bacterium]|nr:hypothetical protein [Caldilineaceae bacterium]